MGPWIASRLGWNFGSTHPPKMVELEIEFNHMANDVIIHTYVMKLQ